LIVITGSEKGKMISRDKDGKCFHTGLKKGEVYPYVLVVGPPGRVRRTALHLKNTTAIGDGGERGIVSVNGYYNEVPVTVLNHDMGAASASIIIREVIDSISFKEKNKATIIRIGSCGSLQEYVKVGDIVISAGCVRDDGTTQLLIHSEYPAVPNMKTTLSLVLASKKIGRKVGDNLWVGITHAKSELYGFESPQLSAMPKEMEERLKSFERMGVLATEMEFPVLAILGDLYNAEQRRTAKPYGIDTGCALLVVSPFKVEGEPVKFREPSQENLIRVGLEALDIKRKLDLGRFDDSKSLLDALTVL